MGGFTGGFGGSMKPRNDGNIGAAMRRSRTPARMTQPARSSGGYNIGRSFGRQGFSRALAQRSFGGFKRGGGAKGMYRKTSR